MFLFPKIFHLFKRAAADVVSNFMLFYFNLNFLYGIRVRYLIVCRYTKDTFYNISITIPITIMNHFEVLKKLKMVHDISIIIEIVEKKHIHIIIVPSPMFQVAKIIDLAYLNLHRGARVLEIGSGSGYMATIMAHLVGPTGHVTGLEHMLDICAESIANISINHIELIENQTIDIICKLEISSTGILVKS